MLPANYAEQQQSEHFTIFYNVRNPQHGCNADVHGLHDRDILRIYLKAAEDVYAFMTRSEMTDGYCGPPASRRTNIYVVDTFTHVGAPHVFPAPDGPMDVFLPSRFEEKSRQLAHEYAYAAAAHEIAHVFSHSWRYRVIAQTTGQTHYNQARIVDNYLKFWGWFDEATALYVESQIRPQMFDCIRYCIDWNDRPEISLDEYRRPNYRGAVFARYLAQTFGPSILFRIWTSANYNEWPWQTISRVLADSDSNVCQSDPIQFDLFTKYCTRAYFFDHYPETTLERKISERFGQRMIKESFVLTTGEVIRRKAELDHLACHYYRLYRSDAQAGIRIDLKTMKRSDCKLKVAIAQEYYVGEMQPPVGRVLVCDESSVSAELAADEIGGSQPIMVAVVNSGESSYSDDKRSFWDEFPYSIEIQTG